MRFISLFIIAIYSMAGSALAQDYKDSDWSLPFYSNCRLPVVDTSERPRSIDWTGGSDRKLVVRLAPGDKGGCSSDKKFRHGAPFWERAEMRQRGSLARGKRHEISFTADFAQGFEGKEETFFQIHGWSKTCNSAPLFMLKFDRRKLRAQALAQTKRAKNSNGLKAPWGRLETAIRRSPKLKDLRGRTNQFNVVLDARSDPATVSFILNGKKLVDAKPVVFRDCATPNIKFGIYRPGKLNKKLSTLVLDDIRVVSR